MTKNQVASDSGCYTHLDIVLSFEVVNVPAPHPSAVAPSHSGEVAHDTAGTSLGVAGVVTNRPVLDLK